MSLDLYELEPNVWYLHVIDEFTIYSNVDKVRSKYVAVHCFLRHWISLFGDHIEYFQILEENLLEKNCMNYIIVLVSRLLQHHHIYHGRMDCESRKQTRTNMLLKIKNDVKCDCEMALAWATSAKNALINNNVFIPAQLVFGCNGNFPNTIDDKLPALVSLPKSSHIGLHISAFHAARRSFLQPESCEKFKWVPRKQTRQSGENFVFVDEVYYKRDDNPEWFLVKMVLLYF